MYFTLANKHNMLSHLLGNIDLIDVSYVLQTENSSSYSSILFCLNKDLLSILYKYDQYSPEYETDLTETGESTCEHATLEIIDNGLVKVNITQKFVRCFSFYKEAISTCTGTCSSANNQTDYISLYPKLFLDFENNELRTILTSEEQEKLSYSKLFSVEYTIKEGALLPTINYIASRSVAAPEYMKLYTFVDNNVNYTRKPYELSINNNMYNLNILYDEKTGEDKYSSYSKTFNVINDSTVIMEFEFYIELANVNYLIDSNDINITYHVNMDTTTIEDSGNYQISLYEKINNNYLQIGNIIYIKDIITEKTITIARILNITNNTITVENMFANFSGTYTITGMDTIEIIKLNNLENFNIIQSKNLILKKLFDDDIFTIKQLNFDDADYLLINELS